MDIEDIWTLFFDCRPTSKRVRRIMWFILAILLAGTICLLALI